MPLHSAHQIEWALSRLLPPPGGDRSPLRPTEERLTPAMPWGRASVQAPLKRGLSPPSGGDWGFLVSCRGHREGRGKKPSVTASPCHLPFQGRFLRCPRTDGAQRRGCRGIGQTQNFPTRTPSRRSNAESLRPPPHRPAWWQVPRQAHSAGAEAVILSPSQAPVGREGVQGPSSIARRM